MSFEWSNQQQMDEDFSQKSKKHEKASDHIEISDDEEILLSPLETIAWDAGEVQFIEIDVTDVQARAVAQIAVWRHDYKYEM